MNCRVGYQNIDRRHFHPAERMLCVTYLQLHSARVIEFRARVAQVPYMIPLSRLLKNFQTKNKPF